MKKDKLLGYINGEIEILKMRLEDYDVKPGTREEESLEADLSSANKIKEILAQHFSITEEDREEAVEWIAAELRGDYYPQNSRLKRHTDVLRSILKALGENE